MKIAMVGDYPEKENAPMSGPTRVTYNLSNELAKLPQNEVIFLKAHRHRHFYKKPICLQDNSLLVLKVTPQSMIMNLLKQEYDIINMIGVSSFHVISLLVKNLQGAKVVYTSVGLMSQERLTGASYATLKNCLLERILLKKADHILVPSLLLKKQIIQDYKIKDSKITVIPYGIESRLFKPVPSTYFLDEFDIKSDNIILCVGGTRKEKGIFFLLESLELIKKEDWLLVIVGQNTKYFEEIKFQFSDLFSSERITHLKDISDEMLLSVYSSSKIFVLPSEQDAYPLTVLEAMASGLPVVISDKVGSGPLVLENETGFVVPYGNISELASKIKYLLNNDKEREEMSLRAKKTSLKYTWEETAKRYMDVYRRITKT